ncbi:MAG: hypothetical protein E2O66_08860 [Deltaproteobacteria bacterium]|nr:MAG: hypothetical protein E2O66_08860 [Deltaproteobacteria bacterium]TDJ19095.1 MAG: hypothetical protein E2O69_06010 [Deltaproteobacteria bacterium]
MGPIGMIGFSAIGLVVVLWLVISFSEASPRRTVLEWLAATGIYVALSMLFLNLILTAVGNDNTVALVAFGFLGAIFCSGFFVSLVHLVESLRGSDSGGASTTN